MGRAARAPRRRRQADIREALRRAAWGSTVGAVVAALALGAGLLRAAVVLASGRPVGMDGFAPAAALYALGFAAAGALVGALWPLRRAYAGRVFLGMLGGWIVFAFIARAMEGPVAGWGRSEYWMIALLGGIMGGVVGHRTFE